MAFPASPSNNQVHKEGNRAFVYDSALGVWDQVRETDRTENKIFSGEIGYGTTFPAGHVIQTIQYDNRTQLGVSTTSFSTANKIIFGSFTPQFANSDILIQGHIDVSANANAAYCHGDIYKNASDVTETANLSGQSYGLFQMNDACIWTNMSFVWLDTCPENSTNTKIYGISVRAHSAGGSATIGWGANGSSVMVLQEIKR